MWWWTGVFFSGNTCVFLIGSGEVHIGGQEHFYMETQSVLAIPRGEDKEMDLFVSTQHPAFIQVKHSQRKWLNLWQLSSECGLQISLTNLETVGTESCTSGLCNRSCFVVLQYNDVHWPLCCEDEEVKVSHSTLNKVYHAPLMYVWETPCGVLRILHFH